MEFCVIKDTSQMKSTLLFILLAAALSDGLSQGEVPAYHRLGILVGPQQTRLLDEQFSPVIQAAGEIGARIWYQSGFRRDRFDVSLDLGTGNLYPAQWPDRWIYNTTEDVYGHVTIDSILMRGQTRTVVLQGGYTYALASSAHSSFSVGGMIRNQLSYPTSFTNTGILNSASLAVSLRASMQAGKRWTLSGEAHVPVIGFNTRFPYSGTVSLPNQVLVEAFFDGGTSFVSLGEYQQVQAAADIRYALSPTTGLGLRYDFMWQQYANPAPMRSYAQRLGVAFDLTF
jgi:hypothetical protein